jgi:predicted nucleotidyltransferase
VQVNGYFGVDFIAAEPEDWAAVALRLPETGVTGFAPTFITAPVEVLRDGLRRAEKAIAALAASGACAGWASTSKGDEVRRLAHDFGMENPRVFGSVARGEDRPGSDLDLLVTVPRGTGLLTLLRFVHAVEGLLGVHVDVVSEGGLGERHAAIRRAALPV